MFSSNTSQVSGGYEIQRSLRFNSADSAYLNRTPASASNRKTWTWSAWIKRNALAANQYVFNASPDSFVNTFSIVSFGAGASEDKFRFIEFQGGSQVCNLRTTQVFRDSSAWYHFVVAVDTTQATDTNRVKMYVNGAQITSFDVTAYPAQNTDLTMNNNVLTTLGYITTTNNFSGYMTEVHFIDGQALTPSSFGAFDAQTGVWGPTPYAGSYGTNGFYLNFSDNSNTTAATLGKDYSGNGNNWTPNNFSVSAGAGNDSLVDVPTNWGTDTGVGGTVRGNYATLNPLALGASGSLANGNLEVSYVTGGRTATGSTFGMLTGKWYWEATITATNLTNTTAIVGLTTDSAVNVSTSYPGSIASSWGYYGNDGTKYNAGSASAYGAVFGLNDVIGVAFDADVGTLTFYKNGTSQGTAFSSLTSGPYYPTVGNGASVYTFTSAFNFGQRPFAYTAPSGFKALNTQNLPTPTIGATTATQANKYFDVVLRNGGAPSGGTYSTTVNMANGALLWDKPRNSASSNYLVDSVRGISKNLRSNTTDSEATDASWFTGFNSSSFTTGSSDWGSSTTVVDWIWAANGAGVTNTAGSITSTVSANTTSGFSVVTWTGNGVNASIGHGLGAAPKMVITKNRDNTWNWFTYHEGAGASYYLELNTTAARNLDTAVWQNTAPTSSVFTIGSGINANGAKFVAYAFAEVPGYSRFGSYTGNGSADGPFVFCGFRPAFVMIKSSTLVSGASNWVVKDKLRAAPYNPQNGNLYPNLSFAEDTISTIDIDFLSNGFKIRGTYSGINESGQTYIFMAFAEAPQKFALAR